MSVSELQRALRKSQADKDAEIAKARSSVSSDLAAKDRIIAQKSGRIAELVEEKNRREHLTEEENHSDLEQRLMRDTLLAVGSLAPVRQQVHLIRSLERCPQGMYVAMQGALDRVISEALAIATDYGIQLNLTGWQDDDLGVELGDPNFGEVIEPIHPAGV